MLGGCRGSTGAPSSLAHDGKQGSRFPLISIRDRCRQTSRHGRAGHHRVAAVVSLRLKHGRPGPGDGWSATRIGSGGLLGSVRVPIAATRTGRAALLRRGLRRASTRPLPLSAADRADFLRSPTTTRQRGSDGLRALRGASIWNTKETKLLSRAPALRDSPGAQPRRRPRPRRKSPRLCPCHGGGGRHRHLPLPAARLADCCRTRRARSSKSVYGHDGFLVTGPWAN